MSTMTSCRCMCLCSVSGLYPYVERQNCDQGVRAWCHPFGIISYSCAYVTPWVHTTPGVHVPNQNYSSLYLLLSMKQWRRRGNPCASPIVVNCPLGRDFVYLHNDLTLQQNVSRAASLPLVSLQGPVRHAFGSTACFCDDKTAAKKILLE